VVSIDDFVETLFTAEQIQAKVDELAGRIVDDYYGKTLIVVTIMQGAEIFSVNLRKAIMNC